MSGAPAFRAGLGVLQGSWERAKQGALARPREQNSAGTLGELYVQADLLNGLLQAKMHAVAAAHGGEHHACSVKRESRALQKLHRTYGGAGAWRRLNDLCRTSIVFDTLRQLANDGLLAPPPHSTREGDL